MRLTINTPIDSDFFTHKLQVVIAATKDGTPGIFFSDNLPKPDRHLLLGMAQSVLFAVQESDADIVIFADSCEVVLHSNGLHSLNPDLLIARDEFGEYKVIAVNPKQQAKKVAGQMLRWFTGTIRLDVP